MTDSEPGTFDLAVSHGADPWPLLARLREQCPASRALSPDGNAAVAVTTYAPAREVLTDPTFRVDRRSAAPGAWPGYGLPEALDANLLNRDGQDHARLRAVGADRLTPAAAERMAPTILALGREAVAQAPGPVMDGVADLAGPIAMGTLCLLFGIDRAEYQDRFLDWMRVFLDPDPAVRARQPEVMGELVALFRALADDRRASPADDLPTAAVQALDAGTVSADEMTSILFGYWFGGSENIFNMMGHLVDRLLSDDELRKRLSGVEFTDPVWDAVVDESLRLDGSVVLAIRRFAAHDTTIAGHPVPAGHPVIAVLGAADRDPDRFADPDALTLGRPGAHLAFGAGAHYCPGASVARVQLKAAAFALLERYPAAQPAVGTSELSYRPSTRTRGLTRLPIRIS